MCHRTGLRPTAPQCLVQQHGIGLNTDTGLDRVILLLQGCGLRLQRHLQQHLTGLKQRPLSLRDLVRQLRRLRQFL